MRCSTLVVSAALALCTAREAHACPPNYAPFDEGQSPRPFPVRRCATVAREESQAEHGFPVRTLARDDGTPPSALVRVGPVPNGFGTVMSVLGPGGETVAGPFRVSNYFRPGRAYWADLNGDGREDFVQVLNSGGCGLGGARSDLGIALSSDRGYIMVSIHTMFARPEDFIDLGDGRCRLVQTTFVPGRGEKGTDGKPHNYWVHHLIEFDGPRALVSRADPRFPVWVWYTHRPNHEETTIITAEQKRRLWARYADRIVRPARPLRGAPVRAAGESRIADEGK